MSASLVGSEMCIRDSRSPPLPALQRPPTEGGQRAAQPPGQLKRHWGLAHLTISRPCLFGAASRAALTSSCGS
eukprot:7168172-Alexandrium_andersonii.AAC.1